MANSLPPATTSFNLARLKALPVHRTDEVWEVATVRFPQMADDNDGRGPFWPTMCICTSTLGGLMTSAITRPGELPDSAGLDAVAAFAIAPHVPHGPTLDYLPAVIRVPVECADDAWVERLRELPCAVELATSLPCLMECVADMAEHFSEAEPPEGPPLCRGAVTIEVIRPFAEAAARFWTEAPWRHADQPAYWSLEPRPTTPGLRAVSVMGDGGEEFGLGFMPSARCFDRLFDGWNPSDLGIKDTIWSMTFEPPDRIPHADLRLWAEARLAVAEDMFPIPLGFTRGGNVRRPNPQQLRLMTRLLNGFASMTARQRQDGLMTVEDGGRKPLTLRGFIPAD